MNKPNIVILDADTFGSDIDRSRLDACGNTTYFSTTDNDRIQERIAHNHILITNKVVINDDIISRAPDLRLICVAATGTNNIDLKSAASAGIIVTNVAGYSTESVVQHTFASLFYLLQHINYYDNYTKSGKYSESAIFTHFARPFHELHNKTWGIIGLGTIGKRVADIAAAFGANVIYHSPSGRNNSDSLEKTDLIDLLQRSDIVSIHSPLNAMTENILDYDRLLNMKKTAFLLNMGRGGIIIEKDLVRIIDENKISGAALDVLDQEPVRNTHPVFSMKNKDRLLITPHIAWASVESRQRLVNEVAENIQSFLKGEMRNQVI